MTEKLTLVFSKTTEYQGTDAEYNNDVWATVNELNLDPHTGIDEGIARLIVGAKLRVKDVETALAFKYPA